MPFQQPKQRRRDMTESQFINDARDIPPQRPVKAKPKRSKSINLRLSEDELAQVQTLAAADDRSIQQFIRAAIRSQAT